MATYKKRGFKAKTKDDKRSALEKQSTTAGVFNTLDEGASKTEQWVVNNQRYIFVVVALVALGVLSFLGYTNFIQEPKENEAMNDIFQAQKYFDEAVNATEKDSLFNLALNGAEGKLGFIDVINNHKGTDAENLSCYYAGMSYLNLRNYENAIKYLSEFKSDDEILGPLAQGGIGDAFVQIDQPEDALDYYEKAVQMKNNGFTTPMFLFKAGTLALKLNKYDKALGYFNRIKNDFPDSNQAKDIDVFIGKAQASIK